MAGFDGHRGWIYYLAITPALQSQSMGTKLYQHAEKWLKNQGANKIHMLIRSDNQNTLPFYEKLGFTQSTSILIGKELE